MAAVISTNRFIMDICLRELVCRSFSKELHWIRVDYLFIQLFSLLMVHSSNNFIGACLMRRLCFFCVSHHIYMRMLCRGGTEWLIKVSASLNRRQRRHSCWKNSVCRFSRVTKPFRRAITGNDDVDWHDLWMSNHPSCLLVAWGYRKSCRIKQLIFHRVVVWKTQYNTSILDIFKSRVHTFLLQIFFTLFSEASARPKRIQNRWIMNGFSVGLNDFH